MKGLGGQKKESGTSLKCKGNLFLLLSGRHLPGRGCVSLQDSVETWPSSCERLCGAHPGGGRLLEWRLPPCSYIPQDVAIGGIHFCGVRDSTSEGVTEEPRAVSRAPNSPAENALWRGFFGSEKLPGTQRDHKLCPPLGVSPASLEASGGQDCPRAGVLPLVGDRDSPREAMCSPWLLGLRCARPLLCAALPLLVCVCTDCKLISAHR